nr:transposase [Pseudarthrobacter albicanus]
MRPICYTSKRPGLRRCLRLGIRARRRQKIAEPPPVRLGRTLHRWRNAFLAYFTTQRSSNGGTEAINGIIELHRLLTLGYRNRDNYRLRMLLAAGGLIP